MTNYLTLLTIISASVCSSTAALASPFNFLNCESVLAHGNLHSTKRDIRPALRAMARQIRLSKDEIDGGGPSNSPVYFSGNIAKMSDQQAQAAIERLSAVESDIARPDLNREVVAYEFRGGEIANELALVEQVDQKLTHAYQKMCSPQHQADMLTSLSLLTNILLLGRFLLDLAQHAPPSSVYSTAALLVGVGGFTFQRLFRFSAQNGISADPSFARLKKFLKKVISGKEEDSNKMFIASSGPLELPTEYHRVLMGSIRNERTILFARHLAMKMVPGYVAPKEMNEIESEWNHSVQNGDDLTRAVFVDQIVYFDKSANNEPVWLFVYRAYRQTPPASRPRRRQREKDVEWQALPQGMR